MDLNSGVGGNRTLVQTSNRRAFYTFSFQLIFELWLTENGPPLTLSPLLESLVGTPKLRCWLFWCLYFNRRQQGLLRDIRLPNLVRTGQWLTIIQSLMQLERSYFRQLRFESMIYELWLNARRAYCSIDLAVKTSRPQYVKEKLVPKQSTKLQSLCQ